jgi:hypothetical protein
VGRDEECEKENRIGEGRRRDDVLAGDVDGGESGRGDETDDEEIEELPIAKSQGFASSS